MKMQSNLVVLCLGVLTSATALAGNPENLFRCENNLAESIGGNVIFVRAATSELPITADVYEKSYNEYNSPKLVPLLSIRVAASRSPESNSLTISSNFGSADPVFQITLKPASNVAELNRENFGRYRYTYEGHAIFRHYIGSRGLILEQNAHFACTAPAFDLMN